MLTFKDLQYFESVVRLKSISKAAEEQFISQPAISFSLKKIENYFDTILLIRGPHALDLTNAGAKLYPLVKELLKLQNELFISTSSGQNYDTIDIAILPLPLHKSIFYLSKVLFNQLYPSININIHEYAFNVIPDPNRYFFTCFSPQIIHNCKWVRQIPHLKTKEIITDSFCLIYNKQHLNILKSKTHIKIGTLFSIESIKNMPIYDEKKVINHLKTLGFSYNKPIIYMDTIHYDDILNYVKLDSSCFALLPQNFIRPYKDYLEFCTVIDLKIFISHHYVAYNQIDFHQFPQAQTFLNLLLKESSKYI